MTKRLTLSNGDLTVGLDPQGQVQELYYPDISHGNHVGSRSTHHKIGLYCEGAVHWLDDGSWTITQDYYPGRLIGRTICINRWLDIRMDIQDYVDSELNVLVRNISVINLSGRQRNVKLFLHQAFVIGDNHRLPDTAQYIPAGSIKDLNINTIAHYRGDTALLVSGQCCGGLQGFDEYSVGHFGVYGDTYMTGVWCDAADGALSANAVEQGQTDSVIGFNFTLTPHDSVYVNYYIASGSSVDNAGLALRKYLREGVDIRTKKTTGYWLELIQPALSVVKTRINPDLRYDIVEAIVSSCANISTDGAVATLRKSRSQTKMQTFLPVVQPGVAALTASTMARLGLEIEASRIYDFFDSAMTERGCLYPSYSTNGSISNNNYIWTTNALPIRLSDTAAMVLSLCDTMELVANGKTIPTDWRKRWQRLGVPMVDFLTSYIDPITKLPKASYQLWTDQVLSSTFDTTLVYTALQAAAGIAERLKDTDRVIQCRAVTDDIRDNTDVLWNKSTNYFYGGLVRSGDAITLDGTIRTDSLLGARLSGLFDDDLLKLAHKTLADRHLCNNGTYLRYDSDNPGCDGASLSELLSLSLIMNVISGDNATPLINTCRTVLEKGGYLTSTSSVASNDVLLKMMFVYASISQSVNSVNNSEENDAIQA